jgi:hypothetical protein
MRKLGLDDEEELEETDDMSQQVVIRSPITHNHYHGDGEPQPTPTPTPTPQPAEPSPTTPAPQPAPSTQGDGTIFSRLLALALAAALGGGLGAGALVGTLHVLGGNTEETPAVDTDTQYELAPLRISSGEPGDDENP